MREKGQALVALIFFVVLAMIYISAAAIIASVNARSATSFQKGVVTANFAEGVVEDALIKLLRDTDYQGGNFNFNQGTASVEITGTTIKTVNVTVNSDDFIRSYQVVVDVTDDIFEVISWKEN